MALRKKGKSWYIDLYIDKQRFQKKVSSNKIVAQKIHDEMVNRRDLALFGLIPDNYPIVELKTAFLNEIKPRLKEKTFHNYCFMLEGVLKHIGTLPLKSIRNEVNIYLEEEKIKRLSPKRRNDIIAILNRMFKFGVKTQCIRYNPISDMPKFRTFDNIRDTMAGEEVKLLLAASGRYRPIWLCFLMTGLRLSELLSLQWQHINLKAKTLSLKEAKTNAGLRILPISTVLAKELEILKQASTSDFVFTTLRNNPYTSDLLKRFRTCLKRANISTHYTIQDLRRTFSTELAVLDTSPAIIQRLLGHEDAQTAINIYTKLRTEELREAVEKLKY